MAIDKIEGLDTLKHLLIGGGAAAGQALRQSLYREASIAFAESQAEVPVDTGMLKNSGQAYGIQINQAGNVLEITLGYGGVASPYAEIVHEDLSARHNAPTKAKFLEDPVKRRASGLVARLATSVDAALKGLV